MRGLAVFVWGVAAALLVGLAGNALFAWLAWQAGLWLLAVLLGVFEGVLGVGLVRWLRTMVPALTEYTPRENEP